MKMCLVGNSSIYTVTAAASPMIQFLLPLWQGSANYEYHLL
jgi:hypothetical protein